MFAQIASLVLSASALASAPPSEGVTLRYRPAVGDVYRLSVKMTNDSAGSTSKIDTLSSIKVVGIEDGSFSVLQTFDFVKLEAPAQGGDPKAEADRMKKLRVEADFDFVGRLIVQKIDGTFCPTTVRGQQFAGWGSSPIGLRLPKEAVKAGGSWEQSLDVKDVVGTASVGVKFAKPAAVKFEVISIGKAKPSGRRAAVVRWTMDALLVPTTATEAEATKGYGIRYWSKGTATIDTATGLSLESDADFGLEFNPEARFRSENADQVKTRCLVKSRLLDPEKLRS